MKTSNNHARTKTKRKALKLKALKRSIIIHRAEAMMKAGNSEAVHPNEALEVQMKQYRQMFDRQQAAKAPIPSRLLNQRQRRRDTRRAA